MRLLLVDDHGIITEGIAAMIARRGEHEVVGTAEDGFAAITQARALRPDVVIMDISMPGMNGIEATRVLSGDADLELKVLVLSMHSDSEFVAEAFRAGAVGYIVKNAAMEEVLAALDAIQQHKTYLSPTVAGTVVETYFRGQAEEAPPPHYTLLSPRERQTLQMLAEGKTVKEIAYHLDISDKTVHAFRQRLMEKLDIHSIAELTKYAIRHGLTTLE